MKYLRIDLYTGYRDDKRYTEKDSIVQHLDESDEVFLERVMQVAQDNLNQFRHDEEDEEDDTAD